MITGKRTMEGNAKRVGFAGKEEPTLTGKVTSFWRKRIKANWRKILRSYMKNTTVHGLKYIIEEDAHWIEKIFWICVCCFCLYGTFSVFLASWRSYRDSPVSFVVETTYLDWNTTFPAVTVCEKRNPDKVEVFSEKFFGKERNLNVDTYVGDVAYFSGVCSSCSSHCGFDIDCPDNLTYITETLRAPCNDLITACRWNGQDFACCDEFEPVRTGFGVCFTINSMQGKRKPSERSIKLISNRITGPGVLAFTALEDIKIAIHSPEDVLFNHGSPEQFAMIEYGQLLEMNFQVVEITNDQHLRDISVEGRNCRFPDENPLSLFPYYSYSACITECEGKAQMEFCGCNHHLMPRSPTSKSPVCNITGLVCITRYNEELKGLKNEWSDKPGLMCDCPPSCTEQEFKIIKSQISDIEYQEAEENSTVVEDYSSKVTIAMASLPTERLSRNVVRTRLDIVVSMGGTAGLFLGASLLSLVEIIYYFFVRRPDGGTRRGGARPRRLPPRKPRSVNPIVDHWARIDHRRHHAATILRNDIFLW